MPNAGQGAWPAFWLYSSSSIPNNQAKRLEIDYEWYGNNHGQIQCAVHNWNADGSHTGGSRGFVNIPGGDAINTWHVYGILVRPDFIIHYIDGQEVWKTPSNPGYMDTPLHDG